MSEHLPEWVDGRAFAGWLEGKRADYREALSEQQTRTLHRLRSGDGRGSLDVVDRMCVRLSLHINEIPEWIWTDDPNCRPSNRCYPPETKERALAMLRTRTPVREISEALNVPSSTVRVWKRRLRDG